MPSDKLDRAKEIIKKRKVAEQYERETRNATQPQNWHRDLPDDTDERREKREKAMFNNPACWK